MLRRDLQIVLPALVDSITSEVKRLCSPVCLHRYFEAVLDEIDAQDGTIDMTGPSLVPGEVHVVERAVVARDGCACRYVAV